MTDADLGRIAFDVPPRQAVDITFGIGTALADPFPFAPSIPLVVVVLRTGVLRSPVDLERVETTNFVMTAEKALEVADGLRRAAKLALNPRSTP